MQPSFLQFGIIFSLLAPLAAAPVSFFGKRPVLRRLGQGLLLAGTAVGAIAAIAYLVSPAQQVVLRFSIPPFDFGLEINRLSAIFFAIVNFVAFVAAVYAGRYLDESHGTYAVPALEGTFALFVFGMLATLVSTSVPAFMVSWEVMSLSSFVLVMADRTAASRKAAMQYFVMAHLGALSIMAGFFVLSGGNPLATFVQLSAHAALLTSGQAILAFVLFFIGFGSKAGLVPLHTWLPEAHPQAPSHVSALMSGVMLKVAVYGFILNAFVLIPFLPPAAALAVMGIGLLSAIFGALHAAVDTDIKRTLAWSSVENLGVIFLMLGTSMYARMHGMTMLAAVTFAAAIFHCIAHAIFKSGLFLAAGSFAHTVHTRSLERMGGLAKRMPTFSGAFLALCLAGAALPPFAGFIGEWMYLSGLVQALSGAARSTQAVLVLALVGTAFTAGIAVFAMVKLFAISQLGAPRSPAAESASEPSAAIRIPVIALAAFAVLGGACASLIFRTVGLGVLLGDTASFSPIVLSGASLSPSTLAVAIAAALLLAVIAKRVLIRNPKERVYQTWNCGQPITSHMEYTATAFSAPIRFFFRNFVGIRKTVTATPLSGASALVMKREMLITGRSFWVSRVHEPISRGLHRLGSRLSRIQGGSIQAYLLFIFVALAVTLLIAV